MNEQYIKPVTAEAGKMSWALMRNPKGLDCHVFVSHAWQDARGAARGGVRATRALGGPEVGLNVVVPGRKAWYCVPLW